MTEFPKELFVPICLDKPESPAPPGDSYFGSFTSPVQAAMVATGYKEGRCTIRRYRFVNEMEHDVAVTFVARSGAAGGGAA
jgi:hypothetical protein